MSIFKKDSILKVNRQMAQKRAARTKNRKAPFHKNKKRDRDYRKPPPVAPIIQDEDFLLDLIENMEAPFLLFLDRVQDPQNLGACLRTADAVGVDAIIILKNRAAPLTETAVSIARGAAEHVPVVQVRNLAETMTKVQGYGIQLVGCSEHTEINLHDADLTGAIGIVMGAEGEGLRRLSRDVCDTLVKIPMLGHVECLNVSVAAGVTLYEVVRQRLIANQKETIPS